MKQTDLTEAGRCGLIPKDINSTKKEIVLWIL